MIRLGKEIRLTMGNSKREKVQVRIIGVCSLRRDASYYSVLRSSASCVSNNVSKYNPVYLEQGMILYTGVVVACYHSRSHLR